MGRRRELARKLAAVADHAPDRRVLVLTGLGGHEDEHGLAAAGHEEALLRRRGQPAPARRALEDLPLGVGEDLLERCAVEPRVLEPALRAGVGYRRDADFGG